MNTIFTNVEDVTYFLRVGKGRMPSEPRCCLALTDLKRNPPCRSLASKDWHNLHIYCSAHDQNKCTPDHFGVSSGDSPGWQLKLDFFIIRFFNVTNWKKSVFPKPSDVYYLPTPPAGGQEKSFAKQMNFLGLRPRGGHLIFGTSFDC